MPKSVGKLRVGVDPTDKPNIGKTGAIKSTAGCSGAQYPFLPGAQASPNGNLNRPSTKKESSATSSKGSQHSFLPKSY